MDTPYLVYEKGQRPWPDEVRLSTESEVRDQIKEALAALIDNANVSDLYALADQAGLVLEDKS